MRSRLVGFLVFLTFGYATTVLEASSLVQTQLRGTVGVNLTVFASRDVDDFAGLEREITARAQESLLRDGKLTTESREGPWLSVTVLTYDAKDHLQSGDAVILLRIELREQVHLARSPSLQSPGNNGAVTWADQSIWVESRATLKTAVLKEVERLIGSFAADVRYANR
jgi:hypothetical protein